TNDRDRDGLGRLAGVERQRAAPRVVVGALARSRRRAVGGGEIHRHRLLAGGRQAHRKDKVGARVRLALLEGHVADRDLPRRVVVQDRPGRLRVRHEGAGGVAQAQGKRLVVLVHAVAEHGHVYRLGGLAGVEGERARGGQVILAGGRRSVRGG